MAYFPKCAISQSDLFIILSPRNRPFFQVTFFRNDPFMKMRISEVNSYEVSIFRSDRFKIATMVPSDQKSEIKFDLIL